METFSRFAEVWLDIFGLHIIESGLFILLVFAIDKLIKLDTRLRYILLLLALIKLFVPPVFSAPQEITHVVTTLFISPPIAATGASQEVTLTFAQSLFLIWLLVATCIFMSIILQNIKLHRTLRRSKYIRLIEVPELSIEVPRTLEIYTNHRLQTPILLGFFRSKLYLPKNFHDWPEKQLNSVVAHELAHHSSKDTWVLALQMLALVFFGFNPLVWMLHRRILHVRELRCDELAIRNTGISPVEYGKFLYDFVEAQARRSKFVLSGVSFAQNKKTVLGRFKHLLSLPEAGLPKRKATHIALPILAAIFLVPFSWQYNTIILTPGHLNDSLTTLAKPDKNIFIAFDQPPEPIGGFAAIQKNLHYPAIARKAGIEGRVTLNVLVNENGEVAETKVLTSLGHNGCDEAAIAAVRAVRWKPAMHRGAPVKVWVGIPVIFKLEQGVTDRSL